MNKFLSWRLLILYLRQRKIFLSLFLLSFLLFALILSLSLVQQRQLLEKKASEPSSFTREEYLRVAKNTASYWLSQQESQPGDNYGRFHDPLLGTYSLDDLYTETHLGYSLIWSGLKNGDESLVEGGKKAIKYYLDNNLYDKYANTSGQGHRPFNELAIGLTYNLLKKQGYNKDDNFLSQLKSFLGEAERRTEHPLNGYATNWQLVEAVAFKEIWYGCVQQWLLCNQGSSNPDIFAPNLSGWNQYFNYELLNKQFPSTITSKGLAGDPPYFPLAYHAFSAAWVARYLEITNFQQPNYALSNFKNSFYKMMDVALNLMGPDGDFAYWGRSNQQSFVLASLVYSFEVAAKGIKDTNPAKASQYKAAAHRAFERLQKLHLREDGLIFTTPKLKDEFTAEGIENQFSNYNGLTILLLSLAYETADDTIVSSSIPADGDYTFLETDGPGWAVLRRGGIWMVASKGALENMAKAYGSIDKADLRYDFGLLRAKKLQPDGSWLDLVLARPFGGETSGKYTLAPRGFYNQGAYNLSGVNLYFEESPGLMGIAIPSTFWNRDNLAPLSYLGETTIRYLTDGEMVMVKVDPQRQEITNYFTHFLFEEDPQLKGDYQGVYVFGDSKRVLLAPYKTLTVLSNKSIFHNSDVGQVFFQGFHLPKPIPQREFFLLIADASSLPVDPTTASIWPCTVLNLALFIEKEQVVIWKTKIWRGLALSYCDKSDSAHPRSLKIKAKAETDGDLYSQLIPVAANSTYELTYWVKTAYKTNNAQVFGKILALEYNASAKEEEEEDQNRVRVQKELGTNIGGQNDWSQQTFRFTTSSQTAFVRLRAPFSSWGTSSGEVWYDQIRLNVPEACSPKKEQVFWTGTTWSGQANFVCDQNQAGHIPSLYLKASQPADAEVYSPLIPVSPSTSYEVVYWVKAAYSANNAQVFGRVFVSEYTNLAKGDQPLTSYRVSSGQQYGSNVKGTTDWSAQSYLLTTTSKTAFVRLRASFSNWGTSSGEVWYDQISLRKK